MSKLISALALVTAVPVMYCKQREHLLVPEGSLPREEAAWAAFQSGGWPRALCSGTAAEPQPQPCGQSPHPRVPVGWTRPSVTYNGFPFDQVSVCPGQRCGRDGL